MLSTFDIRLDMFHETRARTGGFPVLTVELGDLAAAACVVEDFAVAHLCVCGTGLVGWGGESGFYGRKGGLEGLEGLVDGGVVLGGGVVVVVIVVL